ncbi:MAG: YbgC/FadM family acyl-CoA thioesterase [Alphaproteobacteria bacterium]|nr:YbgC/FadM family acyl-CoA thioesterase [Alphaproteobacteria bacterium]MBF0250696.1 YbgC/FadM family acyl-CoA thioesterase [Alphaproteobacteria bacterium]
MTDASLQSRFEGKVFVLPVRIYYEDTDAGGVVYYANYLKFAERARTEMLRAGGLENSTLQDEHGIALVVKAIEAEYRQPARLDDLVEVRLELTRVGGASIEGVQRIVRAGEELVEIRIKLGCMKLAGGPGRLPQKVRNLLQSFVIESSGSETGI